jgi:hypothetical protein
MTLPSSSTPLDPSKPFVTITDTGRTVAPSSVSASSKVEITPSVDIEAAKLKRLEESDYTLLKTKLDELSPVERDRVKGISYEITSQTTETRDPDKKTVLVYNIRYFFKDSDGNEIPAKPGDPPIESKLYSKFADNDVERPQAEKSLEANISLLQFMLLTPDGDKDPFLGTKSVDRAAVKEELISMIKSSGGFVVHGVKDEGNSFPYIKVTLTFPGTGKEPKDLRFMVQTQKNDGREVTLEEISTPQFQVAEKYMNAPGNIGSLKNHLKSYQNTNIHFSRAATPRDNNYSIVKDSTLNKAEDLKIMCELVWGNDKTKGVERYSALMREEMDSEQDHLNKLVTSFNSNEYYFKEADLVKDKAGFFSKRYDSEIKELHRVREEINAKLASTKDEKKLAEFNDRLKMNTQQLKQKMTQFWSEYDKCISDLAGMQAICESLENKLEHSKAIDPNLANDMDKATALARKVYDKTYDKMVSLLGLKDNEIDSFDTYVSSIVHGQNIVDENTDLTTDQMPKSVYDSLSKQLVFLKKQVETVKNGTLDLKEQISKANNSVVIFVRLSGDIENNLDKISKPEDRTKLANLLKSVDDILNSTSPSEICNKYMHSLQERLHVFSDEMKAAEEAAKTDKSLTPQQHISKFEDIRKRADNLWVQYRNNSSQMKDIIDTLSSKNPVRDSFVDSQLDFEFDYSNFDINEFEFNTTSDMLTSISSSISKYKYNSDPAQKDAQIKALNNYKNQLTEIDKKFKHQIEIYNERIPKYPRSKDELEGRINLLTKIIGQITLQINNVNLNQRKFTPPPAPPSIPKTATATTTPPSSKTSPRT